MFCVIVSSRTSGLEFLTFIIAGFLKSLFYLKQKRPLNLLVFGFDFLFRIIFSLTNIC